MPNPILNAGWTQLVVSAFTMHNQHVPPVPLPLPSVPGLIEGPVPMGWPPGFLSHKTAFTVLVDGAPGVRQGHDVGYMIPHFATPLNALMSINTIFSKHKVMIPVSTVQLEGKIAGTYLLCYLGLICADPVSMPTGVVMLLKCTVWTGFSVVDLFKGLAYIAIDVAFDKAWKYFFKGKIPKIKDKVPLQVLGGLSLGEMIAVGGGRLIARSMLTQLGNKVVDHVLKSWVASPLVTEAVRGNVGLGRGDYSIKFFNKKWW